MTSSTVATTSRRGAELASFIKAHQTLIAESLPRHLSADRFTRIALNNIRKTPKLQLSTPESFVGSLLTASALGLEPGVNEECYLVPYDVKEKGTGRVLRTDCQLIIGYQGYAKMFWQHPLARHLDARAVHARDDFDYDYGTQAFLRHKPARGDRGEIIAYYAIAGLSNGAVEFTVLTPDEVAELRRTTRAPEIPDPQHWMERKTALRQLLKLLPKATQIVAVQEVDGQSGAALLAAGTAHQIVNDLPMQQIEPTDVVDEETGEVVAEAQPGPVPSQDGSAEDPAPEKKGRGRRKGGVAEQGTGEVPADPRGGDRSSATPPPTIQQVPATEPEPSPGDDAAVEDVETVAAPALGRQTAAIRQECARLGIQSNAKLKMEVLSRIIGRDLGAEDAPGLTRPEADQAQTFLVGMADAHALQAWYSDQPSLEGE